jgi:hypothetical protein
VSVQVIKIPKFYKHNLSFAEVHSMKKAAIIILILLLIIIIDRYDVNFKSRVFIRLVL